MSAAEKSNNDRINLDFSWVGPNSWDGGSAAPSGSEVGVVDLMFGIKTEISVHLRDHISPVVAQRFPFTCRRYHEEEMDIGGRKFKPLASETHPDTISVNVEQVRRLKIIAGIFEKGRGGAMVMDAATGKVTQEQTVRRSNRDIRVEIPDRLEGGHKYRLVVTSRDRNLSAKIVKEADKVEGERKGGDDERVKKMGEALIREGMQNLRLAAMGGIGGTPADVLAHGMRGVVGAGQEVHPGIQVPISKPAESLAELEKLTKEELQSRFEDAAIKDKELEVARLKASMARNIPEMNKVIALEHANSQLVMNLATALEKKGVRAQMPQSARYLAAAAASSRAHAEALKSWSSRQG